MTTTVRISGLGPVLERVTCRLRRKSDTIEPQWRGRKVKIRVFWTVMPWCLAIIFRRFGRVSFSFFSFIPASLHSSSCFLGAFAKLRKETISFVISVRPSVRMEQLGSHWTDFHEIWHLDIFRKSVEEIQVSLQSDNNVRYCTWRPTYIFYHTFQLFLEWKIFQTTVVDKLETHILRSVTFFRNSYRFWDNVEKYFRAGQATDENMAHAHCMLDS